MNILKNKYVWLAVAGVAVWYFFLTKKGKVRVQGLKDGSTLTSAEVEVVANNSNAKELQVYADLGIPLGYVSDRLTLK